MSKYKLGLVSFQMGAIALDGGMGTSLTTIGDTVAGSALMTQTDDTTTDFTIEESDSPVLSIVSTKGKLTLNISTYNNDVDNLVRLFGGTKVAGTAGTPAVTNRIATLGTVIGGTGYTPGTYNNKSLTGGTGSNATANFVVNGSGVISSVTLVNKGFGYTANNTLFVAASDVGGTGSGFSVPVGTVETIAAVDATGDTWKAPDTFLEQEQSIMLTYKQGGSINIPRAKLTAKPNFQFNKTALTQIDITADVLQPTKTGEPRLSLVSDL